MRRTQAAEIKLFVCGPTPMMRAVAKLAADRSAVPCDVSLEQVMGCGMGGCYSCVVLTREPGQTRRISSAIVHRRPGVRRTPDCLGRVTH